MMNASTDTERAIEEYRKTKAAGLKFSFDVGRYTGFHPSVVAALRRRGYIVEKLSQGRYQITGERPLFS